MDAWIKVSGVRLPHKRCREALDDANLLIAGHLQPGPQNAEGSMNQPAAYLHIGRKP